ncbi:ESPR-type extended signal peptide-containing protein, partial [Psychrobacter aquaticus]|uniref:ESPR-type extended signal peptide-containing protein n=2 Tax=Psychrobacter aquaticus TaxID=248452 RepID=UPI0022348B03
MNRSYKVIWNQSLNCFMAVAEYAKSRGKSSSTVVGASASIVSSDMAAGGVRLLRLSALSIGLVTAGLSISPQVFAAPYAAGGGTANGADAIAIGTGAATGVGTGQSIAIGAQTQATGDQSVALGANVVASGNSSVAIGGDDIDKIATNTAQAAQYTNLTGGTLVAGSYPTTTASGAGASALGVQAIASGNFSTALGMTSTASGAASVALGVNAAAAGQGALAIGAVSRASGTGSVAIGINSRSSGVNSIAIGSGNTATSGANTTGNNATAIGSNSSAAADATAIGAGARANIAGGVAIGTGSIANIGAGIAGFDPSTGGATKETSNVWQSTRAAVALGDGVSITRQLTGLAAGTSDSDAVNVAQLRTVTNQTFKIQANNDTASAVKSSDTVQFVDGKNIKISRVNNGITIATANEITVDSVTAKDVNGNITNLTAAGTNVTNGPNTSNYGTTGLTATNANGNTGRYDAESATLTDSRGNRNESVAIGNFIVDSAGNRNASTAITNNITDSAGNANVSRATIDGMFDAAGNSNISSATRTDVLDNLGNTSTYSATGLTAIDAAGNRTLVNQTGLSFTDSTGSATGPSITAAGINAGNQVITNVADGRIAANSTDAINGSQLFQTSDAVKNVIGGNTINTNGLITTTNIGGTGENTIDAAIGSVRDSAIKAKNTITEDKNIVVTETTNSDGSSNYEVKTKDDLALTSVTTGNTITNNAGVRIDDGFGNITAVTAIGTNVTDGNRTSNYDATGLTATDSSGNFGYYGAGRTVLTDSKGNQNQSSAISNYIMDASGNWNQSTARHNFIGDRVGNRNISTASRNDMIDAAGNRTISRATGTDVLDNLGNTSTYSATGLTAIDAAGNRTLVNQAGVSFTDVNGVVTGPSITARGIDAGNQVITNVADGTATSDAVNLGQLQAASSAADTKTDALGISTATNLGGGATYTAATGTVSAPTYTLNNGNNDATTTDFNNVGSALGNLDGRTTTNTSDIANVQAQANQGFNIRAAGSKADNVQLGETVDFTNTDGNLLVTNDGSNGINYNLAENIDLGVTGSVRTGNTVTNNMGVRIDDGTGNLTAVTATGTNVTNGTDTSSYDATGLTATDANGNTSNYGAETTTLTDSAGNFNQSRAIGNAIVDAAGNANVNLASIEGMIDAAGNTNISTATSNTLSEGNNVTTTTGAGTTVTEGTNTSNYGANGLTAADAAGNSTLVNQTGLSFTDSTGAATGPSITAAGINAGNQVIANVADGTATGDAVNLGQLQAASSAADTKTDALGVSTATNLGGGATYTAATGTVSAPIYTLNNGNNDATTTDFNNVGSALGNLDGRTTTNTSNIANVQAQANQGFNIRAAGSKADNVQLGETVDFTNTDGNLMVTNDGANGINYNLAENIDLGVNGSIRTGNTTVNNAGIT